MIRRPRTAGDCVLLGFRGASPRPCPFVRCKWHLAIDVNPGTGTIVLNHGQVRADVEYPDGEHTDNTTRNLARKQRALSAKHSSTPDGLLDEIGDAVMVRRHTCVLEFIDAHAGGATLDEIAREFSVTRERVRQMEELALRKFVRGIPRLAHDMIPMLLRGTLDIGKQRRCEQCRGLFQPAHSYGTGRYCSRACRQKHYLVKAWKRKERYGKTKERSREAGNRSGGEAEGTPDDGEGSEQEGGEQDFVLFGEEERAHGMHGG